MNKWKELLPVVTAFAEGKVIQERSGVGDKWRDITAGVTPAFSMDVENYRVKTEPRDFWLNIYPRLVHQELQSYGHETYEIARQSCSNRSDVTTIKVREVLE